MTDRQEPHAAMVPMNERVILGVSREHRIGEVLPAPYRRTGSHRYDTHLTLCGLTTGIPTISLGELRPCAHCERRAE